MLKINKILFALTTAFFLSDPAALLAQTTGEPSNEEPTSEEPASNEEPTSVEEPASTEEPDADEDNNFSEPEGEPDLDRSRRSEKNPATNETVIAALKAATAYCSPLAPSEYVIDCLSERLAVVSRQLRGQERFAEVQTALESASKELHQIARQNRSATLPPARFTTQGQAPVQTTRRLTPVDTAKMDVAVSQALAVIEETETILLRSAENSTDRSIQYQQIAAAVGSNKVLLRSI